MDTPLIREDLKSIDKSHGESLNQWAGGLMHIPDQKFYELQYLTMRLCGYMNFPIRSAFLAIRHSMEYIMHYPHEQIIYSRIFL